MIFTYDSQDIHTLIMQQTDDEQLEWSGFKFDCFTEVIIDV